MATKEEVYDFVKHALETLNKIPTEHLFADVDPQERSVLFNVGDNMRMKIIPTDLRGGGEDVYLALIDPQERNVRLRAGAEDPIVALHSAPFVELQAEEMHLLRAAYQRGMDHPFDHINQRTLRDVGNDLDFAALRMERMLKEAARR